MPILLTVAINACIVRYRLDRAWGRLRVAAATVDAYLYAGALFLVVSTAFGRGGTDRYLMIVLGFIALRWTMSCLAMSDTLTPLSNLMAREVRCARLHALVSIMAPPFAIYGLSLIIFLIVVQIFGSAEVSMAGLVWLPALVVMHALLNAAAILVSAEAWRRGWLTTTAPVLIAAALLWFVSPVMYRFDDLGVSGTALLTTFSPASHLLAAYHNTFWFGQPVSLKVLPVVTAFAVLVAIMLLLRRSEGAAAGSVALPEVTGRLGLVVDPENTLDLSAAPVVTPDGTSVGWTPFWPIRAAPRGLTGQDWARTVYALRGAGTLPDFGDFDRRIEAAAGIGDLYRRAISLYPEWAADRLVSALALVNARNRRIALIGLLDALPRDQVGASWHWLADQSAEAGAIMVVTNRLLVPGEGVPGMFCLLCKEAPPHTGAIGTDLASAYAAYLEAASAAPAEVGNWGMKSS